MAAKLAARYMQIRVDMLCNTAPKPLQYTHRLARTHTKQLGDPLTYGEPSQQTVLAARAAAETTNSAMHTPHDSTRLPCRSMIVDDAPPTVSRSHYVPK